MPKAKLSVTVDKGLLEKAMRIARGRPRSEIVESALSEWVGERRRRILDAEIARYYASLSQEELEEDKSWARLGDDGLRRAR